MIIDTFNGYTIFADDSDYNALGKLTWFGRPFKNTSYAYARLKSRGRGTRPGKMIAMHRFLMRPGPGEVVHHRNGNGLHQIEPGGANKQYTSDLVPSAKAPLIQNSYFERRQHPNSTSFPLK